MAEKFEKYLLKLSPKQRELFESLIKRILVGDFYGMDLKPLKGHKGFFRVRKGQVRIVFSQDPNGINLIDVKNRDEQTYRTF
jgi:mRNA-degrading endonuclease RelE of RelBE toxin-antitoxin system